MKSLSFLFNIKSLIRYFLTLVLTLSFSVAKAQIPVEVMVGDEQLQHQLFFIKNLDEEQQFNLFSIARFAADYEEAIFNNSMISSQLTYNLTPNWGITAGMTSANTVFTPLAAISYSYFNEKGDLFLNLFPSVLFNDKLEYELTGILLYTPKLSEKYSLFTQMIFSTSYNNQFDEHLLSYQQYRLGIGYKDLFQVGLGMDRTSIGDDFMTFDNIGIFIRTVL